MKRTKMTWHTSAGGTGAHHGNGYSARGDFGEYHIWPPGSRFGSYSLKWANTTGRPAAHGGLWHNLGSFRSPNEAKRAAKEHAASSDPGARDMKRRRQTGRDEIPAKQKLLFRMRRYARLAAQARLAGQIPDAMSWDAEIEKVYAHAKRNRWSEDPFVLAEEKGRRTAGREFSRAKYGRDTRRARRHPTQKRARKRRVKKGLFARLFR